VTGKEGPERENSEMDAEALEIVVLCQLSFVIVTLRDVLIDPTDRLPKLTDGGLTITFARAADPKTDSIAAATTTF
jgi:hypothetical protein